MEGSDILKFKNPLLVVNDLTLSKKFYYDILHMEVISDFGANVTLTGGISLQTKESWLRFIDKQPEEIQYGGNDAELYFEEKHFDDFLEKLKSHPAIRYVHPPLEHAWGQRVVRFYDPDFHIIEVGEDMRVVCKRFLMQGFSVEETAIRTQFPVSFVKESLSQIP